MTEQQARAAGLTEEQIAALHLDEGQHSNPQSGHCLLEVVSMFAGEAFGDEPECVDPALGAFGRAWNDALPDDKRQELKRYIPLLPGTNECPALTKRRGWLAIDWLLRTWLPAWLERNPRHRRARSHAACAGSDPIATNWIAGKPPNSPTPWEISDAYTWRIKAECSGARASCTGGADRSRRSAIQRMAMRHQPQQRGTCAERLPRRALG